MFFWFCGIMRDAYRYEVADRVGKAKPGPLALRRPSGSLKPSARNLVRPKAVGRPNDLASGAEASDRKRTTRRSRRAAFRPLSTLSRTLDPSSRSRSIARKSTGFKAVGSPRLQNPTPDCPMGADDLQSLPGSRGGLTDAAAHGAVTGVSLLRERPLSPPARLASSAAR